MTRLGSILGIAAALLALVAPAAVAAPLVVAPPGSAAGHGVRLAVGDGGRALVSWTAGSRYPPKRALVAERTASGRVLAPVEVLRGRPTFNAPLAFPGADGDRVLVQAGAPDFSNADLLDYRRDRGSGPFGEPATILHSRFLNVVGGAANSRGDIAVLAQDRTRHTLLLTAKRGAAFGAPQLLGDDKPRGEPAVAVGPTGRLVVVYGAHALAYVRRGRVGGPLGPPHLLEHLRSWPIFSAAIDDRGTSTVAFSRFGPYSRRAGIRTRISAVAARATVRGRFGPVAELEAGADGVDPMLAAAGSTTAIVWQRAYPVGGLRVAVSRGSGRFGRPQSVGTPPRHLGERGGSSAPYDQRVAVDTAGDVLLAYQYGAESTHAALWISGSPRFEPAAVVSSLGHGGPPAVAFLPDRTPLVAFTDDDAVYLSDPGAGTPVNLVPPRVTLEPLDPAEIRRDLRVSTRIRCAQTCLVTAYGRITTGSGRQVRSGHAIRWQVLRAGDSLAFTFDAKPAARAALDASGHAKATVTVTVANSSGATRQLHEQVQFGCRKLTTACPRAPAT